MNREFFTGKTVLVMGLGRFGGGVDVAQFAVKAGAKVVITDLASAEQLSDSIKKLEEFSRLRLGPLAAGEAFGGAESPRRADIEFHLGLHDPADFEQADIIVANPAVPGDDKFLKLARRHNKFITSQISIFFQLCPALIIGITGANGKSTTAALTAHLLKNTRDEGRETKEDRRQKTEDRRQKKEDRRQLSSIEATQDTRPKTQDPRHKPQVVWGLGSGVWGLDRASSITNVWLSGNIGNEPLLTVVDQIAPFDLVVLELSSFQLEQLAQAQKAPQVALLTNLTPNHLDRYGTFADYCAAKENIFKFQKPGENSPAVSIFNAEDKVGAEWFEKYRESGIVDSESGELRIPNHEPRSTIRRAGRICIKFSTDDVSQQIRESFKLPGRANLSNLAAAIAVAKYFGVDDELIRNSLPEFKPLPHRLELVRGSGTRLRVARYGGRRKVGNRESIINFHPPPAGKKLKTFTRRRRARNSKLIDWYNDSKATTPQSAIAALEAFDRPVIIIAGGYDKELPFEELGQKIAEHAKAAILIGQTAPKIASAIRNAIYRESCIVNRESNHESRSTTIRNTRVEIVESLAEAVQLADRLAETGDVVLLSPACASYDMFDNFEQRGCEFKRLVREIVNRA